MAAIGVGFDLGIGVGFCGRRKGHLSVLVGRGSLELTLEGMLTVSLPFESLLHAGYRLGEQNLLRRHRVLAVKSSRGFGQCPDCEEGAARDSGEACTVAGGS